MFRRNAALLFFISCITINSQVFAADYKVQTAEEYRTLGYEQQQKGNLSEALSYYTKASTLGMNNSVLFNDMAILYEEIGFDNRAEQYYRNAVQTDPNYLPPYINLAYLYQRNGKNEEAARYFKLRYELGDPMDPWGQKAKEELIKLKPEYRQWAQSLEAETLNRELAQKRQEEFYEQVLNGQEHFRKGEGFFEEGNLDAALVEYDKALRYSPNDKRVLQARQKIILEKTKKSIREQSEQAIQRLDMGDTVSARFDIQEMLTTIPKEPILLSR